MSKWPKIWGYNEEIIRTDLFSLNHLHISTGGQCSLHQHKHNYNLFYVVSGRVKITTGFGDVEIGSCQNFLVLPGTEHQFEGLEESEVIELVFVKFDPSDIDRKTVGKMIRKQSDETS